LHTSRTAGTVFDYLSNVDTITVPNPYHYEAMYFVDPIYIITLSYADGTTDIIQTCSEGERSMNFLRKLPEMGKHGDYGCVYFRDENDDFLNLIAPLFNETENYS
jgi:hypothetical protein